MRMTFQHAEIERGVLFINRSESRCGSCGGGADPHELTHETLLGWFATNDAMQGCGEPFTAVSTDYFGMEVDIESLRPDLPVWNPRTGEARE